MTQKWNFALRGNCGGYFFALSLMLALAGCGGGGGDGASGDVVSRDLASCESSEPNDVIHADSGDIVAVRVGETATLNGCSSSTTLSDPLTYAWSITSKPDASNTQLVNTTSVNPSFVADVTGTYRVQLVVSSGAVSSQRAIAEIEVTVDGWITGERVHTSYPSLCSECHDGRFAAGDGPVDPVLPKFGAHPATTNMCQACHTTFGFELILDIDHLEVFGNCSTCHDGNVAIGKSEFHVTTNVECDTCHDTDSFLTLGLDGSFDHSGIVRGCEGCHNGLTAIGKHASHFVTDVDCGSCHNTDNFQDAYVDHSNITDDCASCHDGVSATGQTVGHPDMNVDCGICHTTTSFSLGGVFNHRVDSREQSCASCHNDNNSIGARGKSALATHIDTTEDCGVCHGVAGGNFADGIFDHTGITNDCESCHGVTGDGSGPGKSPNHIPTDADCSICHTTGTFVTGTFDHPLSVINIVTCTSCHDGTFSAGKHVNHVPTTQDCDVCHLTTTFVGAVFDHTGITNDCASCHDGNISPGMSRNHMPTARDCSDCHDISNFVDFTGATFDHLGVTNNCADCHDGTIALGKKVDHIPAQTECSQCHIDISTGGFMGISTFMADVHINLSTGCEGCHTSRFLSDAPTALKATTHIPTGQDCHFCHTNNAFTPHVFTHDGISGNCESCHDGSADSIAAGALGKSSDPTPPHPDTTEDCGVCHGVSGTFADAAFDHTGRVDNCNECHFNGTATKMNIGHVPTTEDCSVCHVPGTFATAVFSHDGIVDDCASCHDGTAATATVMSVNHIPTTEDCSVCHNTTVFAGARFDHQSITDNCISCHDGNTAVGKDGNHVPTDGDCGVCHNTTGFIPAAFDHVGIVDNCRSCHDGALAIGKSNGHVQTSQDCGACHTTRGFTPVDFDHSEITNNTRCDSCHIDGSNSATGMDDKTNPAHIPTGLDCRSCHTTATFAGGTWVHDNNSNGICASCHNGTDATGKPSQGHISTNLECDECHSTNGWAPTNFSHDPQGDYPGDHRRNLTCGNCHGNVVTTPFVYPSSRYAPFCAACHEGDFRREGDHNGGSNGTVEQNKDCSGGGRGCHKVSDSGF